MIPIQNGNARNLTEISGDLPQMTDTLNGWQLIQGFARVTKLLVEGRVQETETTISFQGVIQNLRSRDLLIKTEGQRDFNWKMLHTKTDVEFNVDDIVNYNNIRYRIMMKKNWVEYGYYEYHLMQDYVDGS